MLGRLLKAGEGRVRRKLEEVVRAVGALEAEISALTDDELRGKTDEFRARLAAGETVESLEVEAFAVVREAARRVLGQRPFDVQVMGAAALGRGMVAEMKTGEGKTLVSTMPAYLHALSGNGVHVVTVNDYLAARDSAWMGKVHRFLGLEVGLIEAGGTTEEKKRAYAADITYGTNNEFGFDYLRDNMAMLSSERVQRGHHYALVDEVDSILIDEARTPLIIAAPAGQEAQWFVRFAEIASKLSRGRDYEVDERRRQVITTEEGVERVEGMLGVSNLYDEANTDLVHHLEVALSAKEVYKRDDQYIVEGGEVLIVDEFTGRVLEGRRYADGIHQAIEAKEGVEVLEENQTMATITLQNYFRMYEKLGGMTGTAVTEASEFQKIYGLEVVEIPTNRQISRIDADDLIYATEEEKWEAVVREVSERHANRQPVLLGTASIERSEKLSELLKKARIPHRVLNAKNHAQEAEIISQAGRPGAVTVATNMAGRGVDIMLGGNAEALAAQRISVGGLDPESPKAEEVRRKAEEEVAAGREEVLSLGGLCVIGTERHESRRIDNQLRGRSGRQGDPGYSVFYLSAEDELVRRFAGDRISQLMARLKIERGQPISYPMITKAVERAQTQVEALNFEIRRELLKYDDIGNEQREVIYQLRREALEGGAEDRIWSWVGAVSERLAELVIEEGETEEVHLQLHQYGIGDEALFRQILLAGDLDTCADAIEGEISEALQRKAEEVGESWEGLCRAVILNVIDRRWVDHLTGLEYLRSSVSLRGISGSDPIHEYQREAFNLFEDLLDGIADDVIRYLLAAQRVEETPQSSRRRQLVYGDGGGASPAKQAPVVVGEKTGRNDPCPCGSGKKYKRCHGAPVAA